MRLYPEPQKHKWISYVRGTPKISQSGLLIYGITHMHVVWYPPYPRTWPTSKLTSTNKECNAKSLGGGGGGIASSAAPEYILWEVFARLKFEEDPRSLVIGQWALCSKVSVVHIVRKMYMN